MIKLTIKLMNRIENARIRQRQTKINKGRQIAEQMKYNKYLNDQHKSANSKFQKISQGALNKVKKDKLTAIKSLNDQAKEIKIFEKS